MRKRYGRGTLIALLALVGPQFGCDPTLRTNVENSLIDTSTAAFSSLIQAFVEVATEQLAADQAAQQ